MQLPLLGRLVCILNCYTLKQKAYLGFEELISFFFLSKNVLFKPFLTKKISYRNYNFLIKCCLNPLSYRSFTILKINNKRGCKKTKLFRGYVPYRGGGGGVDPLVPLKKFSFFQTKCKIYSAWPCTTIFSFEPKLSMSDYSGSMYCKCVS